MKEIVTSILTIWIRRMTIVLISYIVLLLKIKYHALKTIIKTTYNGDIVMKKVAALAVALLLLFSKPIKINASVDYEDKMAENARSYVLWALGESDKYAKDVFKSMFSEKGLEFDKEELTVSNETLKFISFYLELPQKYDKSNLNYNTASSLKCKNYVVFLDAEGKHQYGFFVSADEHNDKTHTLIRSFDIDKFTESYNCAKNVADGEIYATDAAFPLFLCSVNGQGMYVRKAQKGDNPEYIKNGVLMIPDKTAISLYNEYNDYLLSLSDEASMNAEEFSEYAGKYKQASNDSLLWQALFFEGLFIAKLAVAGAVIIKLKRKKSCV